MSKICDDLRASILQSAMQGKLTNANSDLWNNKLLDRVCDICTGNSISENIKKTKYMKAEEGLNYIGTKDLSFDHSFNYENGVKIPLNEPGFKIAKKDDILLCVEGGSAGRKIGILKENVCYGNKLCKLSPNNEVNNRFLYYFIQSPLFQEQFTEKKTGIIGGVSIKNIKSIEIRYPEITEQKHIVAKVDELMAHVADLEKSADALASLKSHFPNEMRAALLQAAMQGKLTERLPSDGNADELLQQIQAEIEQLIAAGKIKKSKSALAPPSENEIPFPIPDTWRWVRLPDIAETMLGKTLNKSTDTGKEKPYLCSINIYWDGISLDKIKTAKFSENDINQYRLTKNDLLVCEGGDVGRAAIWDSDEEIYYQNALHRIRFYGNLNVHFFKELLDCYKRIGIIDEYSKGVTIKHLVQSSLNQIPIPLPPLAEQKRIVDRLDEAMKNIDVVAEIIASE